MNTERLILRRFCEDDLQDLHEYLCDEWETPSGKIPLSTRF